VERFAEALSMGGIVFHDHPRIADRFPNMPSIVQVNSADEIDREFEKIMQISRDERHLLRQRSFDTWRSSGLSYFHQAGRVLDILEKRTK
jgi:hypothetical protein